MLSLAYAKA
ncbi:hypothetical protein RB213_005474 [Colletotrichum asianum]